jgi:glycosyltransferase involved in cell wall biosynthesis
LAHLNLPPGSGVIKKVLSQLAAWRQLGVEAKPFWITRQPEILALAKQVDGQALFYYGGPLSKARQSAMRQAVCRILDWKPDIVYFRKDLFYWAYLTLANSLPVVAEVNTDEASELQLCNWIHFLYYRATRALLDRRVKGWVFVTTELMNRPYYARQRGKKIVIANGIDIHALPSAPQAKNGRPALVFMGSNVPWHGIDKICQLAKSFADWQFKLIGIGAEELLGAPGNVTAYGFLGTDRYLPILGEADVAIGPLACHRKRMEEASPLKIREYLAVGLPVIVGCKDTDFPEGAPFLLELPNREENVETSLEPVERFVLQWMGKRVPREAVAHLDYRVKERKRLEFFSEVILATRQRASL